MLFSGSAERQDITSAGELPTVRSKSAFAAPGGEACDATSKALGVDELMLLILEKTPTEHLPKLRRVSKKWNDIISSIGYAVMPISFDPEDIRKLPLAFNEDIRYGLEVAIDINPAINSSAKLSTWPYHKMVALESVTDSTQLLSKRQEFITSPPITTITLGLRDRICPVLDLEGHALTATLRDKTGIRIGFLLDTLDKMRVQALQPFQRDEILTPFSLVQPVAFFRYSGLAVMTYHEEGYVQFAYRLGSDSEDAEIADAGGEDNEKETHDNRNHGRLRRSVLRCPTLSEKLSMVFEK